MAIEPGQVLTTDKQDIYLLVLDVSKSESFPFCCITLLGKRPAAHDLTVVQANSRALYLIPHFDMLPSNMLKNTHPVDTVDISIVESIAYLDGQQAIQAYASYVGAT